MTHTFNPTLYKPPAPSTTTSWWTAPEMQDRETFANAWRARSAAATASATTYVIKYGVPSHPSHRKDRPA